MESVRSNNAEHAHRGLPGSMLRPVLGPLSSSSEHLEQLCMLGSSGFERQLYGVNAGQTQGSRLS
eukprot:14495191-Alexandrium_andersonii.AAC.1